MGWEGNAEEQTMIGKQQEGRVFSNMSLVKTCVEREGLVAEEQESTASSTLHSPAADHGSNSCERPGRSEAFLCQGIPPGGGVHSEEPSRRGHVNVDVLAVSVGVAAAARGSGKRSPPERKRAPWRPSSPAATFPIPIVNAVVVHHPRGCVKLACGLCS